MKKLVCLFCQYEKRISFRYSIGGIFRISIVLILLFPASLISFASQNFSPGYVIRNNGDTIRGLIDYQNWSRNPKTITFKRVSNNEIQIFNPLSIKAFQVKDEKFESAIVTTDLSPTSTSRLGFSNEIIPRQDTVFLQALVKGSKSLFFYKNNLFIDQFYIKEDSQFTLLIHKKYLRKITARTLGDLVSVERDYVAMNNEYFGQLAQYLNDCPDIYFMITNTGYNARDLEKLFFYYYECKGEKIDFFRERERLKFEFGILGGVSLTSLSFSGHRSFDYLIDANFGYSLNFTAGASLELRFPRARDRFSIYNDLAYFSYKLTGEALDFISDENYRFTNTTLGYSHIKASSMIRYRVPDKKFKPFFNAGLFFGLVVNETNQSIIERMFYTQFRITEEKAFESYPFDYGYVLGVGTEYDRLSFELRHEFGYGMSNHASLSSITGRSFFIIGYSF
jgi:hypothetical protein